MRRFLVFMVAAVAVGVVFALPASAQTSYVGAQPPSAGTTTGPGNTPAASTTGWSRVLGEQIVPGGGTTVASERGTGILSIQSVGPDTPVASETLNGLRPSGPMALTGVDVIGMVVVAGVALALGTVMVRATRTA